MTEFDPTCNIASCDNPWNGICWWWVLGGRLINGQIMPNHPATLRLCDAHVHLLTHSPIMERVKILYKDRTTFIEPGDKVEYMSVQ